MTNTQSFKPLLPSIAPLGAVGGNVLVYQRGVPLRTAGCGGPLERSTLYCYYLIELFFHSNTPVNSQRL